ncbi:hypothetical protein Aperf_G00000011697 [Anoplocephala perfoliata]
MQRTNSHVLNFQFNNKSHVREEKEKICVSPLIMDVPWETESREHRPSSIYSKMPLVVNAPYQWLTYGQVNEKIEACISGLLGLSELARKSVKCVVEITVAVCDTPEWPEKLINSRNAYPELKNIVLISRKRDLEHLLTSTGCDIEIISSMIYWSVKSTSSPFFPYIGPIQARPSRIDFQTLGFANRKTGSRAPKGSVITSRSLLAMVVGTGELLGSWMIVELGCWAYGMVVVTLYDSLRQEAMTQIAMKAGSDS